MTASEQFLAPTARDPDPLLDTLKDMVRAHAHAHPRHTQVALGPSQVGHPCARNVIQGMLAGNREVINPQFDVLPSYIGVAAHAAMQAAAELDLAKHAGIIGGKPLPRWLPERKVTVTEGLSGTCDLYDTWTNTVIDYKFPGTTKMAEYRPKVRNGQPPSVLYQVQAHLYGKGYRNEGYPVERVGIWLLPRSGLLATSVLWIEPYNEELVQHHISRWNDLILLMSDMDLERKPERLAMIPTHPYECSWCPYFSVRPNHHQTNPYACAGGDDYQAKITPGSGMTAPIEVS